MAVGRGGPGWLFPRGPGSKRQVGFETQNRPDLLFFRLVVELPRRVHVAMVGDREAVHAKLLDMRNQLRDLIGPI
jgi:hypothetical protein